MLPLDIVFYLFVFLRNIYNLNAYKVLVELNAFMHMIEKKATT